MKYLLNVLAALAILVTISCNKNDEFVPSTFDEAIESGGGFKSPQVREEVITTETKDSSIQGESWICKTETKDILGESGGKGGFPLFSPNASVIYPGNMLQGNSLNAATPKIIAVERAGGYISTDVIDGNIESRFYVESITKSSVTEAVNSIVRNSSGVIPANFDFTYKSIQSREEFALSLGVDVNTTFYDLEANLNFSSDKSYNRYYIALNQSYYTMTFDIPTSTEQLFDPSVSVSDLAKYVGPGNPASYISDVTFGRIYYMLVESTSSVVEMDAAISGSFNGITTKVKGEVNTDYMKSLKNLKVTVYAFGGDAKKTLETIGVTNLSRLRALLAESSDIRTAKPISYVVRSVYDNQIVSTQLATKYDVTNCHPSIDEDAPVYSKHWPGLSDDFGIVGASFMDSNEDIILINTTGDQYMKSSVGNLEGPFDIQTLGEGTMPFNNIGAACNIDGNNWSNGTIMLFDDTGVNYTYLLSGVGSNWRSSSTLFDMAGGTCPFNASGIGAISFRDKTSQGPSSRIFTNGSGTSYTYYYNNPERFTVTGNYQETNGITRFGAKMGIQSGNELLTYFFDKESPRYIVSGNLDGNGVRNHGPFYY